MICIVPVALHHCQHVRPISGENFKFDGLVQELVHPTTVTKHTFYPILATFHPKLPGGQQILYGRACFIWARFFKVAWHVNSIFGITTYFFLFSLYIPAMTHLFYNLCEKMVQIA